MMYEPLIKDRIEAAIDEGLASQATHREKRSGRGALTLPGKLLALFRRIRRAGGSRPAPGAGEWAREPKDVSRARTITKNGALS